MRDEQASKILFFFKKNHGDERHEQSYQTKDPKN